MTYKAFIKKNLPDLPGVYFFMKEGNILYIGKATSLHDRIRSYFSPRLEEARGPLIVKMVNEADTIDYIQTDSVLEALILEANSIKKYQPAYNSLDKDDKSYNYVVITDEPFPRVLLKRGRELLNNKKLHDSGFKIKAQFGPYPHGRELQEALHLVRKIFPFRDKCVPLEELKDKSKARPCFNRQLGMCPGVCTGEISKKEYAKTIRNITLFFSAKKKQIEVNLKREMKQASRELRFEKANEIKRQLFALSHIRDVSLLKNYVRPGGLNISSPVLRGGLRPFRIEAYDIAHTSGSETVGVMVVVEDGELNKREYRKFKIRGGGKVSIDDTKNLREVLTRRLGHAPPAGAWTLPNIIVVDGGTAQINAAKTVLQERGFNIDIVSVVKDEKHKPKDIIGEKGLVEKNSHVILLANSEAHRFAIAFHRKRSRKAFF